MSADDEGLRVRIAIALGWKPETRKMYAGEKNAKGWGLNRHLHEGDKDRQFVTHPGFFDDWLGAINLAFQLIEHLREKKGVLIELSNLPNGDWVAITSRIGIVSDAHKSAEMAICEVFLAVMEPTTEEKI